MTKYAYGWSFFAVLTLAFTLTAGGCSGPAASEKGADSPADEHAGHDHGEEHAGPHGGHVIDIGRSHAYHAEIVEDDAAGMITVYMLDKDLKELPIAERTIVMNLNVGGAAQTFELTAVGEGEASEFKAADASLFQALHEHGATGKLRVTIDGTPYSGEITHHDHDEHVHEH